MQILCDSSEQSQENIERSHIQVNTPVRKNFPEVVTTSCMGRQGLSFCTFGRYVLQHLFEVDPVEVQVSKLTRRAAAGGDLRKALFLVCLLEKTAMFRNQEVD